MKVWRLITHHADKDHALFWTKQNNRIAIGWGAIGDIRVKEYKSSDRITAAIKVPLFPSNELLGYFRSSLAGLHSQ